MLWTLLLMAAATLMLMRAVDDDEPDWIDEVTGAENDFDDDGSLDDFVDEESPAADTADTDADPDTNDSDTASDDTPDDDTSDETAEADQTASTDQTTTSDDDGLGVPEDELLTAQQRIAKESQTDTAQQVGEDDLSGLEESEQKELKTLREKLSDDDDYLSVKEVKRLRELDDRASQVASERQQERETIQTVESSIQAAYEVMNKEKMGEGLDFETVHSQGFENLSAKDQREILAAGPKAARVMYQRCIARTPELRAKRDAAKAQTTGTTESKEKETNTSKRGAPKPKADKDTGEAPDTSESDELDAEDLDDLDVLMGDVDGLAARIMGGREQDA